MDNVTSIKPKIDATHNVRILNGSQLAAMRERLLDADSITHHLRQIIKDDEKRGELSDNPTVALILLDALKAAQGDGLCMLDSGLSSDWEGLNHE